MKFPGVQTNYYPESDGRPIGESDEHRDAMVRIIELLKIHFQGQQVYVSGDLLVYYEQGNPKKFVVPDAFIAKGLKQKRRRIYRLWVEGVVPQLVIETTSRKTKKKDTVDKPELYAKLGIREYFMHDPTSDYLDPPLQGYRLKDGKYDRIVADVHGNLFSEELSLHLRVEDSELNLYHPETHQRLFTNQEQVAFEAAARQRETEARQKAEDEVARLRAELAKFKNSAS